MIFDSPPPDAPVDQGDIIDGCPLQHLATFDVTDLLAERAPDSVVSTYSRVLVLTQTCDLAQKKSSVVLVAAVRVAADMVRQGILKAIDVQGPIRGGRVFGWYYLPRVEACGLPESVVDLRQIHTIRRDLLTALCLHGKRRGRIRPLYREHLARHFAETYARIGLPQPYETRPQ
ncbi:MAG: hypothetical protein NTY19_10635 [Planctomycetota bacterium]|nr:hypothetical protein [Planctomycetota bacterium]